MNMNRLTRLFIAVLWLALAACGITSTPATSQVVVPTESPAVTPQPTTMPPISTAAPTQPTSGAQPAPGQKGCHVTQAPSVSESARLTLGPRAGIPPSTAQGKKLILVGTVYADDCTPLAGATLNLWQTDPNGEYGPGHGTDNLQCCYLQGTVRTDASGHYELITVKPGHYKGVQPPPPAHIHVEVKHPDAQPRMTEIVFVDDPYWVNAESDGLIVISLTSAAGPEGAYLYLHGVADMVLQKSAAASAAPVATPVSTGQARTFQIVPEQSEAAYHIREKFAIFPVMTSAVGVTQLLEGALQIDLNDPPTLQALTMTVDLRGLKTDEPHRDEKLADEWLVTNQYPFAYFTATGIQTGPEHYAEGEVVSFTLIGDMTIRDVTRPMTFEVTAKLIDDTVTGSATGTLRMTDFGIDPPNLLDFVIVEDEVAVTVNFTAREHL